MKEMIIPKKKNVGKKKMALLYEEVSSQLKANPVDIKTAIGRSKR
jgi:hypothetical protein